MSATPPTPTSIRVSTLSQSAPTPVSLRPDVQTLAELRDALGLMGLKKLSLEGKLQPVGNADWQLKGRLGATVTQECVVTLEPVATRIDVDVHRIFLRDYETDDAPEVEMPEDDTVEPLGIWIDPAIIMEEVLALALPEYPRKEGATSETVRVTEPGKTPMTDEEARPFAGLAALKGQLGDAEDS
ncbi:MAG: DUF177 domain-containing protein [Sulfitobacter sp.]